MKLAVIAPPTYFSLVDEFDSGILLVLAHWLQQSEEYKEKVKNYEGYKILDNGAAEGQLIKNVDTLLRLADEINANEIVIPDVFRDYESSFAFVKRNYSDIKESGYKPVVALQGKSWKELETYWGMLHMGGYIDVVIGLPNEVFLQSVHGLMPRTKFMYYMTAKHPWVLDYDIHYLGYSTWDDWRGAPNFIRSTDSGIFLKAAIKGEKELPKRHISNFHLDVNMPAYPDIAMRARDFIKETLRLPVFEKPQDLNKRAENI